ncbi:hypothetical protein ACFLVC_03165 [Chloroflexota bacterium]
MINNSSHGAKACHQREIVKPPEVRQASQSKTDARGTDLVRDMHGITTVSGVRFVDIYWLDVPSRTSYSGHPAPAVDKRGS